MVGLQAGVEVIPQAGPSQRHRGDLLLRKGDEVVVVEIKRGRLPPNFLEAAVAQLREYVTAGNAGAGILCVWSNGKQNQDTAEYMYVDNSNRQLWIIGAKFPDSVRSNETK
jgi:hypothetical protein